MCSKAAPGTKYQKCGHRVEGVVKVYHCQNYPNGPDCANPKINHSVTDNKINHSITDNKIVGYYPDCVATGKS